MSASQADLLNALAQAIPAAQTSTDAAMLNQYGCDWTRAYEVAPSAVVFPKTEAEVVALVHQANVDGFKLVPSGGRTGLSGGAVASQGEVVVSFEKMNAISGFNAVDRLVRCEAGVVTANLQAFAQEQGLFYPVDFASSGSSHIGGNIATNAGGIKVIRYGLTRDWVAGLRVVTGTGELLTLNSGLVKNATGYDLRHLMIGSEGSLGMIVSADIKLAPAPESQNVMVLGVPKLTDLLSVLTAFQARLTVSAFEFFSDLCLRKVLAHRDLTAPLQQACEFYALVEFDESSLEAASDAFAFAMDQGWVVDGVVSQSEAQAASLWALREGISESIAEDTPYKNDLAVRVSDVPDFLEAVQGEVVSNYPDFDVCWYGHIGDGNLHLNILKPKDLSVAEFVKRCESMNPSIFAQVQQRNGSISAEHGVGLVKRDYLGYSRSAAEIALMKGVKQLFDPNDVLNPGKLLN